jgi:hypothetical protein
LAFGWRVHLSCFSSLPSRFKTGARHRFHGPFPWYFLVIQKRHILGGNVAIPEVSDADMKRSLEELKLSSTPEAVAQMKQTIQFGREMSTRATGSITETVESIELNPSLKKELFDTQDLPALPR